MFAIVFSHVVVHAEKYGPNYIESAYNEIEKTLWNLGFEKIQDNFYLIQNDDMACLVNAFNVLKNYDWFRRHAVDIRAFRVENWSDFTEFVKG